jgi:ABC-2 type transport system permease protein
MSAAEHPPHFGSPSEDLHGGAAPAATAVIREGRVVASLFALCGFTLRQILGQRKLWLAIAILLFPAAVVVLVRSVGGEHATRDVWEMYHVLMQFVLLMLLMPLVALLYGTALIGAEVEQRTLAYLTTRRLHRGSVLLIRFAATWLVLSALFALAMLALHACVTLHAAVNAVPGTRTAWEPAHDLGFYLALAPAGAAAFLAVFTTISLLASRPLIVSAIYVAVFELVLGNLPAPVRRLSISHPLRQFLAAHIPGGRELYQLPAPIVAEIYPAGHTGIWTLLAVTAVLLAAALALMTFRELVPARVSRD